MKFDRACCIRYSDEWEVILSFKDQVNQERLNVNTDIQPKTSIDEMSLQWLFCGC